MRGGCSFIPIGLRFCPSVASSARSCLSLRTSQSKEELPFTGRCRSSLSMITTSILFGCSIYFKTWIYLMSIWTSKVLNVYLNVQRSPVVCFYKDNVPLVVCFYPSLSMSLLDNNPPCFQPCLSSYFHISLTIDSEREGYQSIVFQPHFLQWIVVSNDVITVLRKSFEWNV